VRAQRRVRGLAFAQLVFLGERQLGDVAKLAGRRGRNKAGGGELFAVKRRAFEKPRDLPAVERRSIRHGPRKIT
jgi:hypothetical protein